ncbi:hypothetical protein DOS84_06995 [Flavobacterium aquariorum]|uniref:Uncharacterized protein n=1 Tax=Flavobacterium aquariorum TaxID=2217670 RepID=A0A2W7TXZ6_9FLAO|nr:hypothetical protein DOS84_06995 [Flavobacterium aquariorum]
MDSLCFGCYSTVTDSKIYFCNFIFLIITKSFFLAPIEVKILISRGSAYKIVTDSGIDVVIKTNAFAPK